MNLESWLVVIGLVLVLIDLVAVRAQPSREGRYYGVLHIGVILIGIALLAGSPIIHQ